jgi:hypothetical protein
MTTEQVGRPNGPMVSRTLGHGVLITWILSASTAGRSRSDILYLWVIESAQTLDLVDVRHLTLFLLQSVDCVG